jgi:hypothetical protein
VRRAAFALLLLAGGCTSAAETAYREQIECLSQYVEGGMDRPFGCLPELCAIARTPEQIAAVREAFRAKAIEAGRALGKSPAQVNADALAFLNEIIGPDAHGSEERLRALMGRCETRLPPNLRPGNS